MKIVWSLLAISDRDQIFDYLAVDSPGAAIRTDILIEDHVDALLTMPEMGRPGRVQGTRELVIQRTPYLAAYTIEGETVQVLRVLHGAQRWPSEF